MTDEDLENIAIVCEQKNCSYDDAVLASFHAGLVLLTEHSKLHAGKEKENGVEFYKIKMPEKEKQYNKCDEAFEDRRRAKDFERND